MRPEITAVYEWLKRFYFISSFYKINSNSSKIRQKGESQEGGKKCSFFRKIWRALFPCCLHLEIRPFALLPTNWSLKYLVDPQSSLQILYPERSEAFNLVTTPCIMHLNVGKSHHHSRIWKKTGKHDKINSHILLRLPYSVVRALLFVIQTSTFIRINQLFLLLLTFFSIF